MKVFTCPVDKDKCEMGSKAEIRTRTWDVPVVTTKKFPAFSIRDTTYCKYSVKNYAAITTDRFKHNNMNILLDWENLTAVYLIWIPRGTPWGDAIRMKKMAESDKNKSNVFRKIGSGNEWWVLMEPKKNTASNIVITSSISLEDMPADEKAAILKKEADER